MACIRYIKRIVIKFKKIYYIIRICKEQRASNLEIIQSGSSEK